MESPQVRASTSLAYEICAVVVLWVALFEFNSWLFSFAEVSRYINWIFLPAALRVVAVLVLDWRGVAGLFAGALFTCAPQVGVNMAEALVLASLSALAPFAAVSLVKRCLRMARDLKGMTYQQLTVIAVVAALTSAVAHNIFFSLQHASHAWSSVFFPMLAGDLIGTLVVLFTSALVLRALPHIAK